MADKFEYHYTAPTKEEQKEIEQIMNKYQAKSDKEILLERLRTLDFKVKNIPIICGILLGIVGVLGFGLGLTFVLEWDKLIIGSVISIFGILLSLIAYPIYKKIADKLKNKYTDEILSISKQLLNYKETR